MVESMNPVVSVCIPVYGVSKYIEKCAISLFEQSIADKAEFVFVNDCTKDDSFEKLKQVMLRYPQLKERIILVEHARNMGLAAARNTGIAYARGEYIICVDSDDWCEKNYLEELYEQAYKTGADIVGCDLYKEFEHKSQKVTNRLFADGDQCLVALLEGKLAGWLHEKLILRKLIIDNDITWIDGLDVWEDVLFSVKIFFFAQKISHVNKPLYHYRYNLSSLINVFSEKSIANLLSAVREIETFLTRYHVYEQYAEYIKKMKVRVKVSIICESDTVLREKYTGVYPEIDENIYKDKNISLIKRLGVFLYIRGYKNIGSMIFRFIKNYRKIRYR